MTAGVAIVTDSTSYLPVELVEAHAITVVPLQVVIGGEPHDEGGDATSATVAEALRSWTPVSTSRPSPGAFLDGFAPAVAVLAGFSALGAIVALALPGRRPTAGSVPVAPVAAFERAGGS